MKAVRIHTYGGPNVLIYEDAPQPQPSQGEVLIRVHAAGVNPVDWKTRSGCLRGKRDYSMPLILGWDVAGVVEEVGAGVTGIQVGEAVYALADLTRDGAYAEYITVAASKVATKPTAINFVQAAAVPLAALTAWQSLFELANLSATQTVLIHGAAGGVGSYAVQLAKWRGAKAIATASASNADFLRELGADAVVDYQATRFEDVVSNVDVVLDTIGGDTQSRSWGVLKPSGVLVSTLGLPSAETAAKYGVRSLSVEVQPNAMQLTAIARLIDSGQIKPIVSTVLPLEKAHQAQELSQSGHAHGKTVLQTKENFYE